MQIGMVGLGRMGMNMAVRLVRGGHDVVAYNRSQEKVISFQKDGGRGAETIDQLVDMLSPPRILWIMLPAGATVDSHIEKLSKLLSSGDVIVDGGNSHFEDDVRRFDDLQSKGIQYLDAGVSGGIWGLTEGFCLMIGGEPDAFDFAEPLLKTLAPENGYLYCGPAGAGHYIKMVHNGIEYAMMQAYGEGFNIIRNSPYADYIDIDAVARLWNNGSVIRSWLLELIHDALKDADELDALEPYIQDSGEGRWTVQQAVASGTPAPVIAAALFERFASQGRADYSSKLLAALRNRFGGHEVKMK